MSISIWEIDIKTEEGLKDLKSHLQAGANPNELGHSPSIEG
jgi:PIN domain nuclease of toxin-antitoxin system